MDNYLKKNYSNKNNLDKNHSNRYNPNSYISIGLKLVLTLYLVLGLSSCKFEKITVNQTPKNYEVNTGDSLTIHWSFNNADRVFVDGLDEAFLPTDSARILPERSKILSVWAYKGNLDSAVDKKYINVKGESRVLPKPDPKDIIISEGEYNDKSDDESEVVTDTMPDAVIDSKPEVVTEDEPEVIEMDTPPEQERVMEAEPIVMDQTDSTDEPAFNDDADDSYPEDEDFVPVQRGPISLFKEYYEVRGVESEYFRGVTNSPSAEPQTVKICSIIADRAGSSLDARIRFLVLDKFGNFLNNEICDKKQNCELKYSCNDAKYSRLTYTNCRKEYSPKRRITNDLTILLDHSIVAENYDEVFKQIKSLTKELPQNDRVKIVRFNQKYEEMCDFSDPYRLETFFENVSESDENYEEPSGLSAVYKSIFKSLDNFEENNANKALIVITHFNDNASLLYKVSDLLDKSKLTGIPIYIIAVGDALITSHLNYIATRSGGAFYHLFKDEIDDIPSIINEIYFSMNNYFEIEFTDNRFPFNERTIPSSSCDEMESIFSIELNGKKYDCQANIFAFELPDYFQYQALALFEENESDLNDQYYSNLELLATTMLDNPNYQVEIIAHTGDEGTDAENEKLSIDRANSVIEFLRSYGVPADRLITKAMGYRKPLYYKTETPWQEALNRRVELRWLDPSTMPFEIIAEVVDNEAQAKRLADKWGRNNIRAYYERAVIDGKLKYQVKLWGYRTVLEAKNEIKRIKKLSPNTDFKVD